LRNSPRVKQTILQARFPSLSVPAGHRAQGRLSMFCLSIYLSTKLLMYEYNDKRTLIGLPHPLLDPAGCDPVVLWLWRKSSICKRIMIFYIPNSEVSTFKQKPSDPGWWWWWWWWWWLYNHQAVQASLSRHAHPSWHAHIPWHDHKTSFWDNLGVTWICLRFRRHETVRESVSTTLVPKESCASTTILVNWIQSNKHSK